MAGEFLSTQNVPFDEPADKSPKAIEVGDRVIGYSIAEDDWAVFDATEMGGANGFTIEESAGATFPSSPMIVTPPTDPNDGHIHMQEYDDGGLDWFRWSTAGGAWSSIIRRDPNKLQICANLAERATKFPTPKIGDTAWMSELTSNGLTYRYNGTDWEVSDYHVRKPVSDLDVITEQVSNQTVALLEGTSIHWYVWRMVASSPDVWAWDRFSSASTGTGDALSTDLIVPTVADLPSYLSANALVEGQGVVLQSYNALGDGAGRRLIYRATGKSGITVDNGWYFNGKDADDYLEQEDKTVANIRHFGAKDGDNTFDSQPAIQAALDACATSTGDETSATGGPEFYAPGGTYYLGSGVTIPQNTADNSDARLTIRGAGIERTVFTPMPAVTPTEMPWMLDVAYINVTGGPGGNRMITISGIWFRGINGQAIGGFDARKCSYLIVEKCTFSYFKTHCRVRNWTVLFRDVNFVWGNEHADGDQLYITDEPGIWDSANKGFTTINQLIFERCLFRSGNVGIRSAPGLDVNHLVIDKCHFDGVTKAAIVLNGPMDKVVIRDCYLEAQGRTNGGGVEVFKKAKGTKWEAKVRYVTGATVYDSAGNWWRNAASHDADGDDSSLGTGSDTGGSWTSMNWTSGETYAAKAVVRDSSGNFWITIDGGTSGGNDTALPGSDTGVTDWEPVSDTVHGAIVLACTMTNTSGPQGEVINNTFLNCNKSSAIRIEGTQQLTIRDNRGTGIFQNIFVTVGNTMKLTLGPASPYNTSDIVIDHNRWSQTDNEIWRKIVHFEDHSPTGSGSWPHCGFTIIDRTPKWERTYPVLFDDLANPKIWKQDGLYDRPMRSGGATGLDEVTFAGSSAMSTVSVFNKRWNGPLSRGGYLKVFGKGRGDDGSVNVKIDVYDGWRNAKRVDFNDTQTNHASFSKEPVIWIEPTSPYRDWLPSTAYSLGDIVRSAYTGREYYCTTGHTSGTDDDRGEDDNTLADTGNWAETARSAANQGRSGSGGAIESPFDWKTGTSYQAGEIVQSDDDGFWYSADTTHSSAGDDSALASNSDTGGNWTKLDRDPTEQPVVMHVFDNASTATTVTVSDFCICSADHSTNPAPTNVQEPRATNEIHMDDFSWAPYGEAKVFIPGDVNSYEHGETVTWTTSGGGSARIIWKSGINNRHLILDDVIGNLPAGSSTITGVSSGNAEAMSATTARNATMLAFNESVNEAMATGKTLRIPAGTHTMNDWSIKTIGSDLKVVCDQGAVIDVNDTTLSFLSLDAATSSSFEWHGGEVRNAKRFLYTARNDGDVTPKLHINGTKFVNVYWIIEDAGGTTAGIIEDGYFGHLDIDNAQEAFDLTAHKFRSGVFEHINFHDFENAVQLSAIDIGSDVGADTVGYGHGALLISNCRVNNIDSGASSAARGFRVYGDNVTISDCVIESTSSTGSSSEGIWFSSKNGVIRNNRLIDAARTGASIRVDGPYQDSVTVVGNVISRTDSNSPKSIDIISTDNCIIAKNIIADGGQAISVTGDHNLIDGNKCIAAHTNGSEANTIEVEGQFNKVNGNTVEGCGPSITTVYGIAVHSTSVATNHTTVTNNTISSLQATTNNFGIAIVGSVNNTNNTMCRDNYLHDLDRGFYINTPVNVDGVYGSGNTFNNVTKLGYLDTATNLFLGVNNYTATAAPGTGDDVYDGYTVGSIWIDVSNDNVYICVDDSGGGAVWRQVN